MNSRRQLDTADPDAVAQKGYSIERAGSGRQALRQSLDGVWLIAKKEIINNTLTLKVPAVFGAMSLLFLISGYLLARDYKQRLDNWEINQITQRDLAVGGIARYNLPNGSFFHTVGTAPDPPIHRPQPLSVIVRGMDNEADRTVTIGQVIAFGPRQNENLMATLYDIPDSLFLMKLLLSLFALFFSLDAVTREKETGTLRALLAFPLSRQQFILGKILGASVSLCVPFVLSYAIAILYLYGAHGLLRGEGELTRAALVLGLGLLYSLVFLYLGLLISTVTARTRTAVVMALLVWGALVIVLPNAAVLAAKLISPSPSYNQFNARLKEVNKQIIEAELRANPGAQSVLETPNAKQTIFRTFEVDRELTDDYIARKWEQIDKARDLAILSPAGALSFGASDLAGTGADAYKSYLYLLREGRDSMLDALERRWDLPPEEGTRLYRETLADVTSRQRTPEPLSASLRSASAVTVSLLAWLAVFVIATHWRFQRYDIR